MGDELKEMEARIVAMVLGEASAFEEAELMRHIENDAQLDAFYLEMLDVHGAIGLAADPILEEDWKLSDARRKLVLGSFEKVEEEPVVVTYRSPWKRVITSVAAVIAIVGGLAMLSYGPVMKQVKGSESVRPPELVSYYASPSEAEALEKPEVVNEVLRVPSAPASRMSQVISSAAASSIPVPEFSEEVASLEFGNDADFGEGFSDNGFGASDAVSARVGLAVNSDSLAMAKQPAAPPVIAARSSGAFESKMQTGEENWGERSLAKSDHTVDEYEADPFADSTPSARYKSSRENATQRKIEVNGNIVASPQARPRKVLLSGSLGSMRAEGSDLRLDDLEAVPGVDPFADPAVPNIVTQANRSGSYAFHERSVALDIKGHPALLPEIKGHPALLPEMDQDRELEVEPREKAKELKKAEEKPVEIDEIEASDTSHSTFSLNVNDASFQLARAAMLERGEWPAAESVRTEEFVNAFDYGDSKPTMAQKVSCAQGQAVHPFLQQRNLLRVSMSTAALGRKSPLNLMILLDNSGSMERPDRKAIVTEALQTLAAQLGPDDRVSMMSFSRETRLLADQWNGSRAAELVELARNRPSEGGTNLEQAIVLGGQHLEQRELEGTQARVVVFTDGAANLGDADPESLRAIIEKLRDEGIAFDACGIGADGLDDGILEALTRKGDGRYYVLDSVEDAADSFAKQIAGALHPAAKNVKVQVVFNPQRVGKYKLLGFEKHRLKKEDFRNDAVDAAEMAAEESGSAVYQIQTKADGEGAVGTVFVRFRDLATGQMVERNWAIPYIVNAVSLEDAEASLQLASVACLLGEKLHQSDAGSVDFSQLTRVKGRLKYHYQENQKVQDLLRMVEMTTR
ncbi:YfbK domain-containing protein [Rubritalea sp.]|uniref:vWA domain-containing protein n=1 Tax=Rubritalea sp. TaxID=2109375 RepID=UPI003EF68801